VGARFSAHVQNGSWSYTASCKMGIGLFQGIKQPVRSVKHLFFSSAEVKKRVELYLYSFSGLSWPATGRTALVLLICLNSPRIRLTHSHTHTHAHSHTHTHTHTHNSLTRQIQTHACNEMFSQKGESLASETKCLMKRILCLSVSFVVTVFQTG